MELAEVAARIATCTDDLGGEAERLRADVPLAEIPNVLAPVFGEFARHGAEGESFGDFCARIGTEQLVTVLPAPTVRRRRAAEAEADA